MSLCWVVGTWETQSLKNAQSFIVRRHLKKVLRLPGLKKLFYCLFYLSLMDSNVCEMCSKIEAHPNAKAISAGLIRDKEYTATFLFTVLWVSFCVQQH